MDKVDQQFPNTISGKGTPMPSRFKQNGWTALPKVSSPRVATNSSPHVAKRPENGLSGSPSHSPRVARRQESGPSHSTSQVHHLTRITCNSLWGQKLTFHPYVSGESLVPFSSLWPERRTLVDTFREAELDKRPYELCKLLLTTNSFKSLDALLDEQVGALPPPLPLPLPSLPVRISDCFEVPKSCA